MQSEVIGAINAGDSPLLTCHGTGRRSSAARRPKVQACRAGWCQCAAIANGYSTRAEDGGLSTVMVRWCERHMHT